MSTIKTTNITHGSNSGTNNIILDDTGKVTVAEKKFCLLYTSPSPRDVEESRMPSSA